MLVFMQSTRYDCQIIMKLEFSRHIFEKKILHISRKSVRLEPSRSMRTDRHDEVNSRFTQFYQRP